MAQFLFVRYMRRSLAFVVKFTNKTKNQNIGYKKDQLIHNIDKMVRFILKDS
jgi:hypothetical protein